MMVLKLRNRRLYPLGFLLLIAAVIVAWATIPAIHKPELLISFLGIVAGFAYFLYHQHLDETKLFKELFTDFNRRFGDLNKDLHAILSARPGHSLSDQEKQRLFSYFNLCAEEYLFFHAGYIDRDVWNSWYRGMGDFFKNPLIRRLWEEDSESDSYYRFQPPPLDPHPQSDRISRTPRS
jgi:hypothetical protein